MDDKTSSSTQQSEKKGVVATYSLLFASLAMTILVWQYLYHDTTQSARHQFEFRTIELKSAILERMQKYDLVIRSTAAFYNTLHGTVSRQQWKTFVDDLHIAERYPGIQGLGLAVVVPKDRLAEHERTIRAEGFPNFSVKPAGDRPFYTSIVYLEPFDTRNKRAFGFDMFSENVRRTAMVRSRDTGETAISGKVTLVQETDKDIQAGFLIYEPLYAAGDPVGTVEQRRAALVGYAYSPFRMHDFMKGIFGDITPDVDIEIYDGTDVGEESLMYDGDDSLLKNGNIYKSIFELTDRIEVYGRTWTIVFRSLPNFENKIDYKMSIFVLFSGICISILIFAVARSINNTRKKAMRLADAMTVAFRQSEENLRLLLESTGEGIYGIDLKGICTFCNPSCLKMLAYASQEALLGQNMHELIHHSHADGSHYPVEECTIYKVLLEGVGMHIEGEVFWRADGTSFPVECWAYPQIRDGKVIGAVVGFVDNTEKVRSRERLLMLNERFELAVTSAEIGIWDWDIGKDRLVWDAIMEAIYGLRPEQCPAGFRAWLELVHADDRDRVEREMRSAQSGGKALDTEFRVVRPSGLIRDIKAHARVLLDADGRPSRMTGVNFDITERKQSERSVRESEAKFRAMSNASNDALIMIDADDTILFWNRAAETMFGYLREEILGQRLHVNLTTKEDQDKAYPGLVLFAKTGSGPLIGNVREFVAIRRDGTLFPVERSVASFFMAGKWYAVGTVRDISERHQMEKMKKEFISTVSHELRTPLTSIRGSLGLILGVMVDTIPEQARQLLTIAEGNTTRLIAMINDLLDIEKMESGKMQFKEEAFDLRDVVAASLDENRHYAVNTGVTLHLEPYAQECPVVADRERIGQVMANLLSNAAKFSPQEGVVDVSLACDECRVRVSVRDHGPGVPEEFHSRIFQKFAQSDSSDSRKRGGSGLGLAIARQIVEHCGGSIGYHAAEGGGSVFYFTLPLSGAAAHCAAKEPDAAL